jgi:hypothetical protein
MVNGCARVKRTWPKSSESRSWQFCGMQVFALIREGDEGVSSVKAKEVSVRAITLTKANSRMKPGKHKLIALTCPEILDRNPDYIETLFEFLGARL